MAVPKPLMTGFTLHHRLNWSFYIFTHLSIKQAGSWSDIVHSLVPIVLIFSTVVTILIFRQSGSLNRVVGVVQNGTALSSNNGLLANLVNH